MGNVIQLQPKCNKATIHHVKLSASVVKQAEYDGKGKGTYYRCTQITGFDLVCFVSQKTYTLRYFSPTTRRQRELKIGTTGDLTFSQAEKAARKARADIAMGIDPQSNKDRAKAAAETDNFKSIAERWIQEYAMQHRKSWKTDERRLLRPGGPVTKLHKLKFGQIDRDELEDRLTALHAEMSKTAPVEANRVLTLINTVLNEAVRRKWIPKSFRAISADIRRNPEQPRRDYLRAEELEKFAAVVRTLPLKHRCSIWFAFLTGARSRSEVLKLKRADVLTESFRFRDVKTGGNHELPITTGIRTILQACPDEGEDVFRGKDFRGAFAKIQAAGFADHITPHTLRHTFRTHTIGSLGMSLEVVDRISNHSSVTGAGSGYVHLNTEHVRAPMERYQTWVFEKAGISDFEEYLRGGK